MYRTIIFIPDQRLLDDYERLNDFEESNNVYAPKVFTTYNDTKRALADRMVGVVYTTQTFVLDFSLLDEFNIIIPREDDYASFWKKEDGSIGSFGTHTNRELKWSQNLEKLWKAGEFA